MRPRGAFRSRVPKKLDWTGAQLRANLLLNGIQAAYVVEPSVIKDFFTSPTLMSTRVAFSGLADDTNLGGLGGFVAFGMIRWMDVDDVAPIFSIPDPLANIDLDWIIRIVSPVPGNSAGILLGQPLDKVYESRARRKLENTAGLLGVFSSIDANANLQVDVRVLLKQV